MLWLLRYRKLRVILPMLAAVVVGGLVPVVTKGFTVKPWEAEGQQFVWAVAGLLTVVGAFAIWVAYRSWLVADCD